MSTLYTFCKAKGNNLAFSPKNNSKNNLKTYLRAACMIKIAIIVISFCLRVL